MVTQLKQYSIAYAYQWIIALSTNKPGSCTFLFQIQHELFMAYNKFVDCQIKLVYYYYYMNYNWLSVSEIYREITI